jgi:hypothetical protein
MPSFLKSLESTIETPPFIIVDNTFLCCLDVLFDDIHTRRTSTKRIVLHVASVDDGIAAADEDGNVGIAMAADIANDEFACGEVVRGNRG